MYLLNNMHGLSGQMYYLFLSEEVKIPQLIKPETHCVFFFHFVLVCKDTHVLVYIDVFVCTHVGRYSLA